MMYTEITDSLNLAVGLSCCWKDFLRFLLSLINVEFNSPIPNPISSF